MGLAIDWSSGSMVVRDETEEEISSRMGSMSLFDFAASCRWSKQQGPARIGGALVRTDKDSLDLILGAKQLAEAEPELITHFKAVEGFVDLSADQVIALAIGVGRYIHNCFAIEKEVCDKIESGEITTFEEIEAAFS